MNLRFTLIDYTTDPLGVETVIDEPVGWDAIKLHMQRDKKWHGFFDFVDDSAASLQFVGSGFSVLKTAYDGYGAQADVRFLIEFQCAEGDSYEELYLGRFKFSEFKWQCGDLCMAECGVEALDCLMVFKNRYDQQVDLDSLTPFDRECITSVAILSLAFTAPDTINCFERLDGLEVGDTFEVSGTASNDGTYTVVSNAYNETFFFTTLVVVETVVNETSLSATLTGCIQIVELEPYTGLNYQIQLPSKIVQFRNDWEINPSAGGVLLL